MVPADSRGEAFQRACMHFRLGEVGMFASHGVDVGIIDAGAKLSALDGTQESHRAR